MKKDGFVALEADQILEITTPIICLFLKQNTYLNGSHFIHEKTGYIIKTF